jgi:hypothetical protein
MNSRQKSIYPRAAAKSSEARDSSPPGSTGITAAGFDNEARRPLLSRLLVAPSQRLLGASDKEIRELSPRQAVVLTERLRVLDYLKRLTAGGLSATDAARVLAVSRTSLWRWSMRVCPRTQLCGRRSEWAGIRVPQPLLERAAILWSSGVRGPKLWHLLAKDRLCPPKTSRLLRTKTVPPCLVEAVRMARVQGSRRGLLIVSRTTATV